MPLPGLDTTGWMFWPRVAPDGRRVAFAWNKGEGRQGVFAMMPGDSTYVTLWEGLMNPVGWSRDGKQVFLVDAGFFADSSRVYAVGADGRGRTRLGVLPPGMEVADVSGDGRRAVLTLHQQRADASAIQFTPGR